MHITQYIEQCNKDLTICLRRKQHQRKQQSNDQSHQNSPVKCLKDILHPEHQNWSCLQILCENQDKTQNARALQNIVFIKQSQTQVENLNISRNDKQLSQPM